MPPSVVLSRPSPCNVPQGYASVAGLPAALLGCHFEHPAFGPYSIDSHTSGQRRPQLTEGEETASNSGLFVSWTNLLADGRPSQRHPRLEPITQSARGERRKEATGNGGLLVCDQDARA
jgi:hypothetical protein